MEIIEGRLFYAQRDGADRSIHANQHSSDPIDCNFVMMVNGDIYVSPQSQTDVKHSSFNYGGRLAAAGNLQILPDGRVTSVGTLTGHYYHEMKPLHLAQFFSEIEGKECDLTAISLSFWHNHRMLGVSPFEVPGGITAAEWVKVTTADHRNDVDVVIAALPLLEEERAQRLALFLLEGQLLPIPLHYAFPILEDAMFHRWNNDYASSSERVRPSLSNADGFDRLIEQWRETREGYVLLYNMQYPLVERALQEVRQPSLDCDHHFERYSDRTLSLMRYSVDQAGYQGTPIEKIRFAKAHDFLWSVINKIEVIGSISDDSRTILDSFVSGDEKTYTYMHEAFKQQMARVINLKAMERPSDDQIFSQNIPGLWRLTSRSQF